MIFSVKSGGKRKKGRGCPRPKSREETPMEGMTYNIVRHRFAYGKSATWL